MNLLSESKQIKELIKKVVSKQVKEETKSCFRVYKAKVVQGPYIDEILGSVCQVSLFGDTTVLTIPYSSKVQNMAVGDIVLVATIFNSFRNAIVWETPNFK